MYVQKMLGLSYTKYLLGTCVSRKWKLRWEIWSGSNEKGEEKEESSILQREKRVEHDVTNLWVNIKINDNNKMIW